ncbi:Smr/MutS family protein, partial [Rhodoferax sp.]|uniref:Smr/MutS family protein n=1 Tax=Rhodoferax sp. TaxID=50421 RepID=UPI002725C6BA|nr:DNA mismatch repair protein MutS [Rhodoferax sp.]
MSGKPVKVSSLADLKLVKREIEAQAQAQAQRAAELARAKQQAASEKDLFVRAAGAVQPLPDKRRVLLKKEPSAPRPMQFEQDEKAVLIEAISDEFDVGTLLDTDVLLSIRRPGIGPDVTRKLRRGDWSIQRQLDLHGLRR